MPQLGLAGNDVATGGAMARILQILMGVAGECESIDYPALEKQYEIADRYLRGYKRRLLAMPLLGAREEAIDMLFRTRGEGFGPEVKRRIMLRTYALSAGYYEARRTEDEAEVPL